MSVAAIISKESEPVSSIPVATETAFEELWKPGIGELHLEWLPLFQSGIVVRPEDWPEISAELVILKEWAARTLRDDEQDYVIRRIDRLLSELPAALSDPEYTVWIG